jgi:hypothetical protein
LSFCAFSTWKMPFPSWTGHQQVNCSHVKRWPKAKGSWARNHIHSHYHQTSPFPGRPAKPIFLE